MENKNNDELFQRLCNLDGLYDASYRVCRSVRWKDSTISFEENRLNNILQLEEEIRQNEYQQMIFNCFSIIERGKPRDIRACHIYDRLLQNTLCSEVLLPELTPKLIYDNCATLQNKGTDFALQRVKKHLQAAHRNYGLGKTFYGLRIDIKKYFDSIDHQSLKTYVRKYIKDEQIKELVYYIIDTFCYSITKDIAPIQGKDYFVIKNQYEYKPIHPKVFYPNCKYFEFNKKGLGLGSQTSQLLALLALNEIDHYIKEQLHIKYYGRYMDDIYILHNDKKYLNECLEKISLELNKIGLAFNNKKTVIIAINPVENYPKKKKQPFKYLKWNFYLTNTNKIIQIPFREKIRKQRRKLRKMQKLWLEEQISIESIEESYRGWRAHIAKGTTFYILQDMDNYFKSLFKGAKLQCI